ncbi:MAG: site-2 protease family protein [Deltaproteobacteria bacterium]|nr:site-2 protease family protein [Deltaproteobacteria bacterium]
MFGKRIPLFKILGFEVRLDLSWFILAILITWSLAKGFFPHYFKDLPNATYWWMGVVGTLGLLISIVLHELSHSLVARRYGIPMKGITLFIFGGVAEMDEEPPSPKAEFLMAVVGPLASILIALLSYQIYILGKKFGWPVPVNGIFLYLGIINMVLAIFNLIPGFPLDGGRMLRSALWYWKKNIKWATRVSSQIGAAFGLGLIILGVASFIFGNFIGGIWWVLIGFFLRNASQMSYQQLFIRKALEGEHVSRFMKTDLITVSASMPIEELVEDYFYKHLFKMYPVLDNSKLIGCVTTRMIKEIPKEDWKLRKVVEIVSPCTEENSIRTDTDAMDALSTMYRSGNSRLMVLEDGKLVGIIVLKDMMKFLSLKMDIEKDS